MDVFCRIIYFYVVNTAGPWTKYVLVYWRVTLWQNQQRIAGKKGAKLYRGTRNYSTSLFLRNQTILDRMQFEHFKSKYNEHDFCVTWKGFDPSHIKVTRITEESIKSGKYIALLLRLSKQARHTYTILSYSVTLKVCKCTPSFVCTNKHGRLRKNSTFPTFWIHSWIHNRRRRSCCHGGQGRPDHRCWQRHRSCHRSPLCRDWI